MFALNSRNIQLLDNAIEVSISNAGNFVKQQNCEIKVVI